MPEKLIHCQSCRALLNPDLAPEDVRVPEFAPLPEIDHPGEHLPGEGSTDDSIQVAIAGYFIGCPACRRELRIRKKFRGQRVQCKFCDAKFALKPKALGKLHIGYFLECPHCRRELRAARKYLNTEALCKHCNGRFGLVDDSETDSPASKPSRD